VTCLDVLDALDRSRGHADGGLAARTGHAGHLQRTDLRRRLLSLLTLGSPCHRWEQQQCDDRDQSQWFHNTLLLVLDEPTDVIRKRNQNRGNDGRHPREGTRRPPRPRRAYAVGTALGRQWAVRAVERDPDQHEREPNEPWAI